MFDEEVAKRVIEVEQCSDRIVVPKVSLSKYMPTTDHKDDEI